MAGNTIITNANSNPQSIRHDVNTAKVYRAAQQMGLPVILLNTDDISSGSSTSSDVSYRQTFEFFVNAGDQLSGAAASGLIAAPSGVEYWRVQDVAINMGTGTKTYSLEKVMNRGQANEIVVVILDQVGSGATTQYLSFQDPIIMSSGQDLRLVTTGMVDAGYFGCIRGVY